MLLHGPGSKLVSLVGRCTEFSAALAVDFGRFLKATDVLPATAEPVGHITVCALTFAAQFIR